MSLKNLKGYGLTHDIETFATFSPQTNPNITKNRNLDCDINNGLGNVLCSVHQICSACVFNMNT